MATGQGRRLRSRVFAAGVAALLSLGWATTFTASASAEIESTIHQEGDNDSDNDQDGTAASGDVVIGQTVGINSSGDASVDARNRVEDADGRSGDANGTNDATSFTGNEVLGPPPGCPETADVSAQQLCPSDAGVVGADIETDSLISVIVQEGDNTQSIDQSADVSSGDVVVGGQVVGVISAGIVDIVIDNIGEDVEGRSGDAEANNVIEDAEASNLVTFFECPSCPLPDVFESGIEATTINAVIVHDGDNDQSISQAAEAASGDAVSGSQVVGAVAATTGQISIDARNRGEDTEATSGDADANNTVGLAISGNTVENMPGGCPSCPEPGEVFLAGIEANEIDAVIVHEGDNDQTIDQAATAVSGDAISGSQIVGAVGAGVIDIVIDNIGEDAEATSGDATAENVIEDAEAGNFVGFAPVCEGPCTLPGLDPFATDIEATTITAVIVQSGDNTQSIGQAADASSGDAVSAGQVVGAVAAVGGDVSIDARNRGEDTEATTGDAEATNTIGLAASGNAVFNLSPSVAFLDSIDAGSIEAVNIQDGDNDQTIDQAADATSGDAVAGAQVIGAIGGNVDAVLDNVGRDVELETGEATTDNSIEESEVGLVVVFPVEVLEEPGLISNEAAARLSDALVMALALLAGIGFARRRRPALATPEPVAQAVDPAPGHAAHSRTQLSTRSSARDAILAGVVVLGGILLARRISRS